jgi:hypothetical protein
MTQFKPVVASGFALVTNSPPHKREFGLVDLPTGRMKRITVQLSACRKAAVPMRMSDLDLQKLGRWMANAVPALGRPVALVKFATGQSNPTYRLQTEMGATVLRRKPFGALLPSAHAGEREHRLMSALHPTGFPVPRPLALCEDPSVIGAPFYLMEFIDGRTLVNGMLPDFSPLQRRRHYLAICSATIWMGTQRQSGWPFRRSRREDDCRGATITQAIFA